MDSRALVQQKIGSQTIGSSFFTVIFLSFRSFPNLSGENPLENKELEDEHQETKVWKQTSGHTQILDQHGIAMKMLNDVER